MPHNVETGSSVVLPNHIFHAERVKGAALVLSGTTPLASCQVAHDVLLRAPTVKHDLPLPAPTVAHNLPLPTPTVTHNLPLLASAVAHNLLLPASIVAGTCDPVLVSIQPTHIRSPGLPAPELEKRPTSTPETAPAYSAAALPPDETGAKATATQPSTGIESGGRSPFYLAAEKHKLWAVGSTLKIKFTGGSPQVRRKIRYYGSQWTEHANIDFDYVEDHEEADIRIAFERNGGTFSMLGTDALSICSDKPTINFSSLSDHTTDKELQRTVLHEFGHLLGCIHEHQQPHAAINWKRECVFRYYEDEENWSREKVECNVFRCYKSTEVDKNSSVFDSSSIMSYLIPPSLTHDNVGIPLNHQLSANDIATIRKMYPHTMHLETGTVHASGILTSDDHDRMVHTQSTIQFARADHLLPEVLLGLNSLWIDDPRIHSEVSDVSNTGARVHLKSWVESDIQPAQRSSSCSWLAVPQYDKDVQFGRFICSGHDYRNHASSTYIPFPRPYHSPPKVAVWFSSVHVVPDAFWELFVTASDVTCEGFRITITSLPDTIVHSASAVWLAHSDGREDICSGIFGSTVFPAPRKNFAISRLIDWGYSLVARLIDWRSGRNPPDIPSTPETTTHDWTSFDSSNSSPFKRIPRLFLATNRLTVNAPMPKLKTASQIRIYVDKGEVTRTGFHWTAKASLNSTDYGIGASYIAFR